MVGRIMMSDVIRDNAACARDGNERKIIFRRSKHPPKLHLHLKVNPPQNWLGSEFGLLLTLILGS